MIQAKDVIRVTGISYRQIQYWDSKIVNVDRVINKEESSEYRSFKVSDVIIYAIVSKLKNNGISLQKIRRHYLPQIYTILSKGLVPGDRIGLIGENIVVWDGTFHPEDIIKKLIEIDSILDELGLPMAVVHDELSGEKKHTYI